MQNVDPAVTFDDERSQAFDGRLVRDIADERSRCSGVLLVQLTSQRSALLLIEVGDHHAGPGLSEAATETLAENAGGAGHYGHLAFETDACLTHR